MSLADDRAAFVAALETVPGINAAYPKAPGHFQKGDAFPVFVALESDGFGFGSGSGSGGITWAATVVLGQDLSEAEEMLDTLLNPLRAALRGVMTLGRLSVGPMVVSGAQVLVVQQTGIREYGGA